MISSLGLTFPYRNVKTCRETHITTLSMMNEGEEWLFLDDPENIWHLSGWLWLLQRSWMLIAFWWGTATATVVPGDSHLAHLDTAKPQESFVTTGVSLSPSLHPPGTKQGGSAESEENGSNSVLNIHITPLDVCLCHLTHLSHPPTLP